MNNEKKINYGLIIPQIESREQGAEHLLGSIEKFRGAEINPTGDWSDYIPDTEPQSNVSVETQACTCFGTLNAVETLLRFNNVYANYSDRYLAIAGKVDKNRGADPHAIAECLRKTSGCLNEERLPFTGVASVEEYYNVPSFIFSGLMAEAQQWYDKWEFAHEWVFLDGTVEEKYKKLEQALKRGTVCVSVSAWYQNDNGLYYKPQGAVDNHWTMLVSIKDGISTVFDSYDSFTKTLVKNYDFSIAKVYYITPAQEKLSILSKILELIGKVLMLDFSLIAKNPQLNHLVDLPPVATPPVEPTQPKTEEIIEKKPMPTIDQFATAIKHHEGYFKPREGGYPNGSLSYINNNPGNLRFTPYVVKYLGALPLAGKGGFAKFLTYDKGFTALCVFIQNCKQNMVKGYHDATIKSFFERYAPSEDNNNPLAYAEAVAKRLGVDIDFEIKDLI